MEALGRGSRVMVRKRERCSSTDTQHPAAFVMEDELKPDRKHGGATLCPEYPGKRIGNT